MDFDPKQFLKQVPHVPGVYQMLGEKDVVLYVGKARDLKQRLASYFRTQSLTVKTQSLMQQVKRIDVTITREYEALLLESNLIKHHLPRYNVLLRDDKSYPYIYLSLHEDFPRMYFSRGKRELKGRYFGPYPNSVVVRETLHLLQKVFKLRQCNDQFFKSRTRPCLLYQIKRCSAPCVNLIDREAYQQEVARAILFLQGKSQEVIAEMSSHMEQASKQLNYERAAIVRDQIALLKQIQLRQDVANVKGEIDVIGWRRAHFKVCISVLMIRKGLMISTRSYFPEVPHEAETEELLTAFMTQYYSDEKRRQLLPEKIYISNTIEDVTLLSESLSHLKGKKVSIHTEARTKAAKQWLLMAELHAAQALKQYLANRAVVSEKLTALKSLLHLTNIPERIECFDISHTAGELPVASCVVFHHGVANKSLYRRFHIEGITPGDDYAAMHQVLFRRYRPKSDEYQLPDLVLIDGGKGQLRQAEKVFEELNLVGKIALVAVAKGAGRKPGLETLFLHHKDVGIHCDATSSALHLIQQIRDEAHRFAITGHRQRRAKVRNVSVLEQIPGIGAKKRRDLLKYFGGIASIKIASVDDLMQVPGINRTLAEKIVAIWREKEDG